VSDKPGDKPGDKSARESRPSQRSFSTSDEGDSTPIPPPAPEEMTPDPRLMLPVLRPSGLDLDTKRSTRDAGGSKRDDASAKRDDASSAKRDDVASANRDDAASAKRDAASSKRDAGASKRDDTASAKRDAGASKRDDTASARRDAGASKRDDTASAKRDAVGARRDETNAKGSTTDKERPDRAKTSKPVAPPDVWDRAGAWFVEHGAVYAVWAVTVGILIIHAHIFTGETAGDDLSFHFAESARISDCLRHFDFDLWNPSANGGYASAYYYQVLPQLASALPAAIFGHHLFWFQLSVVLPHVIAPIAAYRGMRLLGATPWQAAVAAFCVAFMNGESRWGAGNAGTFQVGLYTQTWALCAFPLALGHSARWLQQGTNLASAVAWGAFVFLCHPFAGVTLGLAVLAAWLAQPVLWVFDQLFRALAPLVRGHAGWLDAALADRWENPPKRVMGAELFRGAVLAVLLAVTWLPVILPLLIDREGFGGFPHRVSDEVGPGFKGLWGWVKSGKILDYINPKDPHRRFALLTFSLPAIVLFARSTFYRWLWAPALVFALLLGLGPHMGKIGDDLFPPVRALGALQTVVAMGIGAGAILIGKKLWDISGKLFDPFWPRNGIAAAGAVLVVLIIVPGSWALSARVRVLEDVSSSHPDELFEINKALAKLPQGRKQPGPGAENHWWNLLPYTYERVPTTIQMGGGGLQASPNYDFLWTQRDFVKTAWIFDAPYVVFQTSVGSKVPSGEQVGKTENYEIRKLPSPGIVSPVNVTGTLPPGYRHDQPGHKAALDWIRGDQPMKDEVLAYSGWESGLMGTPAGHTVRAWRQDSPGDDADIVAELEVEKPTTFTVRESWHPRWHAYIDGNEVPVRRVTPDFPAVDVPAGTHVLEMRFERPWWMLASWLAWPLVSLAAWFVLRRRRLSAST
jgi:hypothetical protein